MIGHLLVIVCDTQAQIAASGMNDQIQIFTIAINLNKVVAATERPQTFPRPTDVDLLDTTQIVDIKTPMTPMGTTSDIAAIGGCSAE